MKRATRSPSGRPARPNCRKSPVRTLGTQDAERTQPGGGHPVTCPGTTWGSNSPVAETPLLGWSGWVSMSPPPGPGPSPSGVRGVAGSRVIPTEAVLRSADLHQVDDEHQRVVGCDPAPGWVGAVAEARRDDQLAAPAHPHADQALDPARYDAY